MPDQLDTALDYESVAAAGSMLGSGGGVFVDDQRVHGRPARSTSRKFYRHESCGKCTPCREGTHWMENILTQIEHGEGRLEQIDARSGTCAT